MRPPTEPNFLGSSNVDSNLLARTVFVGSTRLGQDLETKRNWFDALRTLAFRIQLDDQALLTSQRTTAHTYVKRIAQLLGIPLLELQSFPTAVDSDWVEAIESQTDPRPIVYFWDLDSAESVSKTAREPMDCVLASIANQVYAISTRSGGNVAAALENRLATSERPTFVLADRSLTKKSTFTNLIDQGALPWFLYRDPKTSLKRDKKRASVVQSTETLFPNEMRLLSVDEVACEHFLLHWTRRRVGAWPDQTQESYLDDLIFQSDRADHQPLHALSRILASRKLVGSTEITRDSQPVICMSAVPLSEVLQRKTFRPHLARWDFEPFGVAILRQSLKSCGARPVIYGDQSRWESLSEEDRPFFQLEQTKNGKIDWTEEKEWRLTGDLDLRLFDSNQMLVFVPTLQAARAIASLCHWPIVVLDEGDS